MAGERSCRFSGRHAALWLGALLMAWQGVCGCGSVELKEPDPLFEQWRARAESSQAVPPATRRQHLALPDKTKTVAAIGEAQEQGGAPLPTMPVSLTMHNVELPVLLRSLARAANQNILINERVSGKVQVNIDNVPWDQAFRAVLRTHGLAYAWEGSILRVMTADDLEQELKREAQKRDLALVQPLATRIVRVDYANATQLRENLQGFLSRGKEDKSRGTVMVDGHTNSLIISAIPEDIERIVPLIEVLDRPTSQVHIEAHIIEADQEVARELGVEWGGLSAIYSGNQNYWIAPGIDQSGVLSGPLRRELTQQRLGSDSSLRTSSSQTNRSSQTTVTSSDTQGTTTTDRTQSTNRTSSDSGTASSSRTRSFDNEVYGGQEGIRRYPSPGTITQFPSLYNLAGGMTLGLVAEEVGRTLLSMQLNALQEEGKLTILSRPSITTLDNQKAIFESGRDIPYQTVEDNDVNIEWKKAVLKLEVIPHVIDENTLKLVILTNKDEVDFSNAVLGNPSIITKRAETTVILRNGQTTVIGGLAKQTDSERNSGVPWMKDVPLLGSLFKNEGNNKSKEEVLIFITPRILTEQPVVAATPAMP
jgi:type IV pilus assembly protein PilQ